jgi:hypothetical protein
VICQWDHGGRRDAREQLLGDVVGIGHRVTEVLLGAFCAIELLD